MDTSQTFHEVVRGTRTDGVSVCLRGLLRCAEVAYTPLIHLRNVAYDRNPHWTQQVPVPVICVGNLTMGGTGKTPLVRYLADCLRQCGFRVALVSRGYGARDGAPNDEARELAEALPDVPHVPQMCRTHVPHVPWDVLGPPGALGALRDPWRTLLVPPPAPVLHVRQPATPRVT